MRRSNRSTGTGGGTARASNTSGAAQGFGLSYDTATEHSTALSADAYPAVLSVANVSFSSTDAATAVRLGGHDRRRDGGGTEYGDGVGDAGGNEDGHSAAAYPPATVWCQCLVRNDVYFLRPPPQNLIVGFGLIGLMVSTPRGSCVMSTRCGDRPDLPVVPHLSAPAALLPVTSVTLAHNCRGGTAPPLKYFSSFKSNQN